MREASFIPFDRISLETPEAQETMVDMIQQRLTTDKLLTASTPEALESGHPFQGYQETV